MFAGGIRNSRKTKKTTTGSSDSISTAEIEGIILNLRNKQHRESTKKSYLCIWKTFNEFIIKLDVKPSTWEQHLTLFVTYVINEKKKSSTVKSYISAVKAILADGDIEINEDWFLLNSLTRVCRLNNDRVWIWLPIHKDMLNVIISTTTEYFMHGNQVYLTSLYSAMFATMYYGLFRVEEVTESEHTIKACDLHMAKK